MSQQGGPKNHVKQEKVLFFNTNFVAQVAPHLGAGPVIKTKLSHDHRLGPPVERSE